MKYIKEELDHFLDFLKEIEEVTGQMPMVILEFTGHYHTPVIQNLEEQGILYILLNPIISYQAKKTSLRKVKWESLIIQTCERTSIPILVLSHICMREKNGRVYISEYSKIIIVSFCSFL
ncbi:hypothetical protein SAMN05878482_10427 [Peribacillus simplex]|uniref:Transposase n=1 Tax=Peribacillus simplex TaxID=1478 RepID=A0A9X8R9T9_9BACI|nr:hypothetical protein [Peribacillus simplex]SIR49601.1 hypothetical protein SAMN05878482_10427 [Peribacillus simplex]